MNDSVVSRQISQTSTWNCRRLVDQGRQNFFLVCSKGH